LSIIVGLRELYVNWGKTFQNNHWHHRKEKDFNIFTHIRNGDRRHGNDYCDNNDDRRWVGHRHSATDVNKAQVIADTSRDRLAALDVSFDHVSDGSRVVEFPVKWWMPGFSDNPSLSTAAEDHSPIVEWCSANHARCPSTLLRYDASNFSRRRSGTEGFFLRLSIFQTLLS